MMILIAIIKVILGLSPVAGPCQGGITLVSDVTVTTWVVQKNRVVTK